MFAIFEDGSRQYRAELDSTVVIDFRDLQPGQQIEITKVLLLQSGAETIVGRPLVEGARIIGEVTGLPTKKTMIQRFRRRKNYRRLKGHTQPYLRVKIKHILKAGEPTPA